LDNDFINKEEFGNSIKARYKNNASAYQIKVLGNFGSDQTGGEFYSKFGHGRTVKSLQYNSELPLILSWDFNVLPFSACIIATLSGKTLNIIDEIALTHPYNRPVNVIREFVKRYPDHRSGIYITGDASGKNNSTRTENGVNDYTVIFEELRHYIGVKDHVPPKNPNVFQRGEFINALFSGDVASAEIFIDERCHNLIQDLLNIKSDQDGTKLKKRVKDKITTQSMELWGHMSDALDIMVCQFLKDDFKNYLRGGDATLHVGNAYTSSNLY